MGLFLRLFAPCLPKEHTLLALPSGSPGWKEKSLVILGDPWPTLDVTVKETMTVPSVSRRWHYYVLRAYCVPGRHLAKHSISWNSQNHPIFQWRKWKLRELKFPARPLSWVVARAWAPCHGGSQVITPQRPAALIPVVLPCRLLTTVLPRLTVPCFGFPTSKKCLWHERKSPDRYGFKTQLTTHSYEILDKLLSL